MNSICNVLETISRFLNHVINQANNPLNSLPDFSDYNYQYGEPPAKDNLPAWKKMRECERRWVYFKRMISLNDPAKAQHRVILDDALSAFLLSYEATLQYVKETFKQSRQAPDFDQWIKGQPAYDILVKGIRTLRLLEAHVYHRPITSQITAVVGANKPNASISRTWKLQELDKADLDPLHAPKLCDQQLPDWNSLVDNNSADALMERSLAKLRRILDSAENEL